MTEVPNLKKEESFVTIKVEENDVTFPNMNNPPTMLKFGDVMYQTASIEHTNKEKEAGFDLTDFKSEETFCEVLEELDIDPYWNYYRVENTNYSDPTYCYIWANEQGMILLGNNPITGEWSNPDKRPKDWGYGSYIGIEGTEQFVTTAFELIKNNGYYKDFNPHCREFL